MKTEEQKIKAILENKIIQLGNLVKQMQEQVHAIDQNDESSLMKILDAKETVIASLVSEDRELETCVGLLDEKSRGSIAEKFKGLGTQIENEMGKIIEIENRCEEKLNNEKLELFEKMKSMKNGRTLLKGYGVSKRVRSKFSKNI